MSEKEAGEREFRVTLSKGRRWAHLRVESMQDNAPRHQERRLKLDMTKPGWAGEMCGFIVGFMGEEDGL